MAKSIASNFRGYFQARQKEMLYSLKRLRRSNSPEKMKKRTLAEPARMANKNGVLVLLRMSSKWTRMPLGLLRVKNLVRPTPKAFPSLLNSLANPLPSWTNSSLRSTTKCQGKALQNVETFMLRSSGAEEVRLVPTGKADCGVITYLQTRGRQYFIRNNSSRTPLSFHLKARFFCFRDLFRIIKKCQTSRVLFRWLWPGNCFGF